MTQITQKSPLRLNLCDLRNLRTQLLLEADC